MKPILKWAGGKARLAASIASAFGERCEGTYYEPFVGSAAVYLHLKAAGLVDKAVLSDANPKLIEVHRAVRDELDALLSAIDELPTEDWRDRYYEVRESYNDSPQQGVKHAARFLWLNRAGFNGLYRENKSGAFNVPVGRYAALNFPSREHFQQVSELLQGTELVESGFEQVMRRAGEGDHVYCDPPYVPLTETASFTGYCKSPFGHTEQKALATSARRAAFNGARVVLSNHDLPIVRNELYPSSSGFEHVARPRVARAIGRSALSRGKVPEVIAAIGPLQKIA